MVLLAICDARYHLTAIDVGQYGSNNHSGVLLNSKMGKNFEIDCFYVPAPEKTLDFLNEMSLFLFGDEIFPLKHWLMWQCAGKQLPHKTRKIFNYRLSRAPVIIENIFGILESFRWRIFQNPIGGTPKRIEKIVFVVVTLHNYLNQTDNPRYTPAGFIDLEDSTSEIIVGQWRKNITNNLQEILPVRNSRYQGNALEVWETFAEYFISESGLVSWQWDYIRRTGRE